MVFISVPFSDLFIAMQIFLQQKYLIAVKILVRKGGMYYAANRRKHL